MAICIATYDIVNLRTSRYYDTRYYVKQMCSHCGHQRSSYGKVNPHIRDTPAASYCLQPFYSEGLHLETF